MIKKAKTSNRLVDMLFSWIGGSIGVLIGLFYIPAVAEIQHLAFTTRGLGFIFILGIAGCGAVMVIGELIINPKPIGHHGITGFIGAIAFSSIISYQDGGLILVTITALHIGLFAGAGCALGFRFSATIFPITSVRYTNSENPNRFADMLFGCICGSIGSFAFCVVSIIIVYATIIDMSYIGIGIMTISSAAGGGFGMGINGHRTIFPKFSGYHGYTGFLGAAILTGFAGYLAGGWIIALTCGISAGVGGGAGAVLGSHFSTKLFKNKSSVNNTIATAEEYNPIQDEIMQESLDKIKSLRHDMKMHLSTLKDFTMMNKTEDVTDYINSLLKEIGDSEVYSETGNLSFDTIINSKLKNVKKADYSISVHMQIPPVITINAVDIVTIMGNLLDNALEAVAKTDEKIINLNVILSKGALSIKVENSFNGQLQYMDGELISLKSGSHGYGLKNVKRTADKYEGHVKISHTKNNLFSVVVLLFVEE